MGGIRDYVPGLKIYDGKPNFSTDLGKLI